MSTRPDFFLDDGGREAAGYKGHARDCACRALAIAARMPYGEAYDLINRYGAKERSSPQRGGVKSSARAGVWSPTMRRLMSDLGWTWVPLMKVGQGCTVHVRREELPHGRLILRLSRHYAAFIDGVLHDTHDSSRGGSRCVYGFWRAEEYTPERSRNSVAGC